MSEYRVIGIGGNRTHLEGYIRSFASDPRCEVVAIADEPDVTTYRKEQNQALAAELNLPYLSLDEALEIDGVNIACACPDIERRGRILSRCFDAGLHVYMDKPLAGSVEDAVQIERAASKAGTVTQMFSQVNTPWAQAAKRAILDGKTGVVAALHCDMLMAKGHLSELAGDQPRTERGSDGKFTFVEAKRELFDMGVYPVSLATWLSGQRVREVEAITTNYFFSEHEQLDIEDFGAMLLTFEDGTIATAMAGRIGVHSYPTSGQQQVSIIGDRGYFRFADSESKIEVYSEETIFSAGERHPLDPMMMWASTRNEIGQTQKRSWQSLFPADPTADIRAFVDCIDSGKRPEVTVTDAVHHVEVIMAGYESARTGRPVKIS